LKHILPSGAEPTHIKAEFIQTHAKIYPKFKRKLSKKAETIQISAKTIQTEAETIQTKAKTIQTRSRRKISPYIHMIFTN
jgi:chaperonin cofactor prefoldin